MIKVHTLVVVCVIVAYIKLGQSSLYILYIHHTTPQPFSSFRSFFPLLVVNISLSLLS